MFGHLDRPAGLPLGKVASSTAAPPENKTGTLAGPCLAAFVSERGVEGVPKNSRGYDFLRSPPKILVSALAIF